MTNCCCDALDDIAKREIRSLQEVASVKYTYETVRKRVCKKWMPRWICAAYAWITLLVLVGVTILRSVVWTARSFTFAWQCRSRFFGPDSAVDSLNKILTKNLANNIALGFGVNTPANSIPKLGWRLTFNDEFDTPGLDTTKWYTYDTGIPNPFPGGPEFISSGVVPIQYYDASAIKQSGGVASLLIERDPQQFVVHDWGSVPLDPAGQPYQVTVDHKVGYLVAKETRTNMPEGCQERAFAQRFGYFETRCQLPKSPATWPAFWLSGDADWPPEIDVFEIFTSKDRSAFESNYHWGAVGQCFDHQQDAAVHHVNEVTEAMHIYACEWDSCFIKWYYDNLLVRVAHRNVTNVFEPMHVVVCNGIDAVRSKNYAADLVLPASFDVDYVRVYARS